MLRKLLLVAVILLVVLVLGVLAAVLLIDPDDYRDEIAERASATLGREVRLDGPMSLKVLPRLALDIESVTVGNPAAFSEAPPLARVGRARASMRILPLLQGRLETGSIALDSVELVIASLPDGASNLDGLLADSEASETDAAPDLSGLDLGALSLSDMTLTQLDLASGAQSTLRLDALDLDGFRAGQSSRLSLSGRFGDQQGDALIIESLSALLTVAADLSRIDLADLALDYELPALAASGQAEAELQVNLGEGLGLVLQAFETRLNLGQRRAGLRLNEPLILELAERIDLALNNATLMLDDQELKLSGELRLADALSGQFDVSGDRIDLRPWLAQADSSEPSAPGGDEDGAPQDFSALRTLDLRFGLALETLVLSDRLSLSPVAAEARLRDGRLLLSPMNAGLFGGRFDGRVEVDFTADPPTVSLAPQLVDVAVARLVELVSDTAVLSGLGNVEVDLDFKGLDPQTMLSSLNGSGGLSIQSGALEGVDLRALINEELTVSNLANVSRAFGGRTEFETLSAQIEVRDGVVELPAMNLSAAGYGASGQGRIDLGAGQVDYALNLALGPELTERLPRSLRQSTGGTIPLRISGAMTAPMVTVDINRLLEGALRRELEDRLFRPRGESEPEAGTEQAETQGTADGQSDFGSDSGRNLGSNPGNQDNNEASNQEEPPPERRERTSQRLLRSLMERPRESSSESEQADEAEDPPPQDDPG